MASTISAGTTSGTALNIQSDTSGNLAFKTGASNVTAMTLDSDQNVSFANNVTYTGTIQGAVLISTGNCNAVTFNGAGTGLTGTAASLTAGVATNATAITNSGGWSVTPSGTKLYFNYNGANVASLDSSGNLICLANITAYGTP